MEMGRTMPVELDKKRHAYYLKRILQVMPSKMAQYDSNRLMFAFFAISGLDVLNCLDMINETEKTAAIEWIYGRQVSNAGAKSGFQPSTMISDQTPDYQCGYLPMTYTGLATLLTLGDDLSRVDKKSIIEGVKACQNSNGCFMAMITDSECDMRFLYCACCVSAILDDWSGVDRARAIDYIIKSIVSLCSSKKPTLVKKNNMYFVVFLFEKLISLLVIFVFYLPNGSNEFKLLGIILSD